MEETCSRLAPSGLQDVLNRLAVVALSNKPVCFYECFADALERDVIRRTLLEIQAEQYKSSLTSDIIGDHADPCELVSPRSCLQCGQVLAVTAMIDSTDPSASDTDYERTDEAQCETAEHPSPRVVVSDPSLVSSRSSTPLDGFAIPPAPLTGSDDECASLLSSDAGGYVSSDDLDSEYVSAMEVPEPPPSCCGVVGGRESVDTFNELDDADVFGSACDNESSSLDNVDEDDDNNDLEDVMPMESVLNDANTFQESSNSASTLLEDTNETPRDRVSSSSEDDSDDDDDDDDDRAYGGEMKLLTEVSDDADGEDNCLNNPTEPLLVPAGDSDLSDAN